MIPKHLISKSLANETNEEERLYIFNHIINSFINLSITDFVCHSEITNTLEIDNVSKREISLLPPIFGEVKSNGYNIELSKVKTKLGLYNIEIKITI